MCSDKAESVRYMCIYVRIKFYKVKCDKQMTNESFMYLLNIRIIIIVYWNLMEESKI